MRKIHTSLAILTCSILFLPACHSKQAVVSQTSTMSADKTIYVTPRTSNSELMQNLTFKQQQKIIDANTHIHALTNDFMKNFNDLGNMKYEENLLVNQWVKNIHKKYSDHNSLAYKQQMNILDKYNQIRMGDSRSKQDAFNIFANLIGETMGMFPDNNFFMYNPSSTKEILERINLFQNNIHNVKKTLNIGAKGDWMQGINPEFKPLVNSVAQQMYREEVPISKLSSDLVLIREWVSSFPG